MERKATSAPWRQAKPLGIFLLTCLDATEDRMQTDTLAAPATAGDTFPINGTDYIEF